MKAAPKLFADETTAPVLDPWRGQTKTGQLFAYSRDDRPWGGSDLPGVAYVYAADRKAERPIAHLKGFTGILQVDGYGGHAEWPRPRDAVDLVATRFDALARQGLGIARCRRLTAPARST